jgi:hypothetical protein
MFPEITLKADRSGSVEDEPITQRTSLISHMLDSAREEVNNDTRDESIGRKISGLDSKYSYRILKSNAS